MAISFTLICDRCDAGYVEGYENTIDEAMIILRKYCDSEEELCSGCREKEAEKQAREDEAEYLHAKGI